MTGTRCVSLFRNGRNQAVRIPREYELAGTQALIRKDGDSLVITPIKSNRLLEMLSRWQPLDDDSLQEEDLPPQERSLF